DELNSSCTCVKSAFPAGSLTTRLNTRLEPVPLIGVIDVTVGGPEEVVVVQVPLSCKPLVKPSYPVAEPYTFCVPVKLGMKVMATGRVKVLVEVVTAPPLLMLHW